MVVRRRESEAEVFAEAQARYLSSLYDFSADVLGDGPVLHEPLHRPVADFLQDWKPGKFIKILLIPREHLKTTVGGENNCLFQWARQPNFRVLYAHGQLRLGKGVVRNMKKKMRRPLLQALAPDSFWENPNDSPLWHQEQFCLPGSDAATPSLTVTSEGANTTGQHYHLIVCDDLVHKDNVKRPELRKGTKDYFHGLIPQLLPGGRVLVLGTRWHHDDLYGYLLDPQNKYSGVIDSMILDCGHPGDPIYPPTPGGLGFTREELEMRKLGMDPYSWSCQYMNNPTPVETQHFRLSNIEVYDFLPGDQLPIPPDIAYKYYTAVDPNRSEATEHDPAVVMTVAVTSDGHYWVVDVSRGHPGGPELITWIRAHALRWRPEKVLVEANNFQMQLQSWLKEDMLKTGYAYRLDMVQRGPTSKKFERILRLERMVSGQRLHVRRGFDFLLRELEFWPSYKNDDGVDALADIYQYADIPRAERRERPLPVSGTLISTMADAMLEDQQRTGVVRVPYGGVRRVGRFQ